MSSLLEFTNMPNYLADGNLSDTLSAVKNSVSYDLKINPTLLAAVSVLFLGVVIVRLVQASAAHNKSKIDLPGPKGWPFIGIGVDLPKRPREILNDWLARYGETFQVRVGWYNWVFFNSRDAVKEVFDRQAAVTSAKPKLPMAQDYVLRDYGILPMTYGPKWRNLRALMHQILTPKASDAFIPSQEFEIKQLLADFAGEHDKEASTDFYMYIRRMTFSIMMTTAYGMRIPKWDCKEVYEVYGNMRILSIILSPGTFWIDTFPPLAWVIPKWIMPSFWMARKMRNFMHENTMRHWNDLKVRVDQGVAPECFAKTLMESNYKERGLNEEVVSWLASAVPEAGAETTASALNSLLLHLAMHPEAQEAAAEEVTRVVGSTRCPDLSDEPNMPYIRAVIKEILRMCPVATTGLRRLASDDFQYKGTHIPAGTILLANINALHWDPERYDEPFKFKPERFLQHPLRSATYANMADVDARDHFTFGAGRRICPGVHLAENGLFLAVSNLMWAFRFAPPIGPDGKEIVMDFSDSAFQDGAIRIPKPYKVRIIPRDSQRTQMVKDQWAEAQRTGYMLRGQRVKADGTVEALEKA